MVNKTKLKQVLNKSSTTELILCAEQGRCLSNCSKAALILAPESAIKNKTLSGDKFHSNRISFVI